MEVEILHELFKIYNRLRELECKNKALVQILINSKIIEDENDINDMIIAIDIAKKLVEN